MAYPRRDIAKTCAAAAVGTTSAVVVAANPSRMSVLVKNDSGADVYLKLATSVGATPVATADEASLKLAAGGSFATTDYTGPIAGIAGSAVDVTVVEV